MLNEKEIRFINEWEKDRLNWNSPYRKISKGLPMAILFASPIFVSVMVVYVAFPEWYTKISTSMAGSLFALLLCVFFIVLFFSYFRMHFKWEMNEQLYQELKQKAKKYENEK